MSFWYRKDACSSNKLTPKNNKIKGHHYGSALLGACAIGAVAQAQDQPDAGVVIGLDVTQRFEYSDNPDLAVNGASDAFARTILGLSIDSVTRTESFTFDLGTEIEEGRRNQSSVDFNNSFLSLGYERESRNASVEADLSYRESDFSSSSLNDDFLIDGNVIDQNTGTRKSFRFGVNGAVGREAPIGASFEAVVSGIRYSGTTDPDLINQDTRDISGRLDFRIDPRITASLTARRADFDTNGNGVDRESTQFGAELSLEVTQRLMANVSLGHSRIERTGTQTGTDKGLNWGFDLIRVMPNGTMGLSLASEVNSNTDGRRTSVQASRALDFASGSSLAVTVGLTRSATSGGDPLLELDYIHALPRGQLSLGLTQSITTDANNDEEIKTTLSAGYNQEINALSSVGVNFSMLNRNELGAGAVDGKRVNLNLSYRRALSPDWDLVGGYSHTYVKADDTGSRRANTVSIDLQRSFSWGR